jgi:hypothetical protein
MKYKCEIVHGKLAQEVRVTLYREERPADLRGWHATLFEARQEAAQMLMQYAAECERQAAEIVTRKGYWQE